MSRPSLSKLVWCVAALVLVASAAHASVTLSNVSYDVTREFYKEYNQLFIRHWRESTGEALSINQSHGGSSKQARSVADGLEADVVTFNQATDIDFLAEKAGLIAKDWAAKFPNAASPFTSTIVFVVRKGNAKQIKEWSDLTKPGVSVVIPNPKTSGNGRYSYLAAWGWALRQPAGSPATAKEFVTRLFKQVPVLDAGGRGATTTFAQRGIGDVLLTFENEAYLALKEFGGEKIEVVWPRQSILAETPVSVVDKVVDKRGTRKQADAYLRFLYSPDAQELGARHFFRSQLPEVAARHAETFKPIETFTIQEIAGSWAEAQRVHFADGGIFDQIFSNP